MQFILKVDDWNNIFKTMTNSVLFSMTKQNIYNQNYETAPFNVLLHLFHSSYFLSCQIDEMFLRNYKNVPN